MPIDGNVRKIFKPSEDKIKACRFCGKEVRENDKFCWNCGKAVLGEWVIQCQNCKRLFKTVKPEERKICNNCERENMRSGNTPGLFKLR